VDVGVKVGVTVIVGVTVDVGVKVGVTLGVGHISIPTISQFNESTTLTNMIEALLKNTGTGNVTGKGVDISMVPASSQYTFRTSQT
jgi:hypothetical protein